MKLHTDHAFHIGLSHLNGGKPNQDYAVSGKNEESVYAIISDGCSSGRYTDVGARIITHSVVHEIKYADDYNPKTIAKIIEQQKVSLGLVHEDMLATLGSVIVKQDIAHIRIVGDGVAAIKYDDGSIRIHKIEWNNNTPFYLEYYNDGYDRFCELQNSKNGMAANVDVFDSISDTIMPFEISTEQAIQGITLCEDAYGIHSIAVFSDGVTQVDNLDWVDVVKDLLAFKSTQGGFVKRRMNGALRKWKKLGKGPLDDIAMAAIHIEYD